MAHENWTESPGVAPVTTALIPVSFGKLNCAALLPLIVIAGTAAAAEKEFAFARAGDVEVLPRVTVAASVGETVPAAPVVAGCVPSGSVLTGSFITTGLASCAHTVSSGDTAMPKIIMSPRTHRNRRITPSQAHDYIIDFVRTGPPRNHA
ncbi:MAG TPA: hypothetical protein VFQ54_11145 [Thermomicrobiales bacterium]|nr:hypothetical protein [Thermomicrobiales bacterium]